MNSPYSRSFSFAGFQANRPKDSLPGQRLDIELDTLGNALGDLRNDLTAGALLAGLVAGSIAPATAKQARDVLGALSGTDDASGMRVVPNKGAAANTIASLLSGGTTLPQVKAAQLLFDGVPSLSHAPMGNPFVTLANGVLQTYSASDTTREMTLSLGMINNHGAGITDPTLIAQGAADKITLYVGHEMGNGSKQGWAINTVTNILVDNQTWTNAWGFELDINNVSFKHAGDETGSIQLPIAWGLDIVAGGNARITAGIHLWTYNTEIGPIFNRGLLIEGTRQADVESQSSAAVMLRDLGYHVIGADFRSGKYTQAAIALPNNYGIQQRTTGANPTDVPILNMDANGVTHVYGATGVQIDTFTKVRVGGNPDSTGQPSGTYALTVYDAINTAGANGLLVKANWAASTTTVLEAGLDIVGGAYQPILSARGDRQVYLWDGTAMSPVKVGAANSGPGGSGRALYLQ